MSHEDQGSNVDKAVLLRRITALEGVVEAAKDAQENLRLYVARDRAQKKQTFFFGSAEKSIINCVDAVARAEKEGGNGGV